MQYILKMYKSLCSLWSFGTFGALHTRTPISPLHTFVTTDEVEYGGIEAERSELDPTELWAQRYTTVARFSQLILMNIVSYDSLTYGFVERYFS